MKPITQKITDLITVLILVGGCIALCGYSYKQYQLHKTAAFHQRSIDTVEAVSSGMKEYKVRHGEFPACSDFPAMVSPQSPLVKEGLVPPNLSLRDYWGNPYSGHSNQSSFALNYSGSPTDPYNFPPITLHSQ